MTIVELIQDMSSYLLEAGLFQLDDDLDTIDGLERENQSLKELSNIAVRCYNADFELLEDIELTDSETDLLIKLKPLYEKMKKIHELVDECINELKTL